MNTQTQANSSVRFAMRGILLVALAIVVMGSSAGCINQMAGLLYVIKGHKVPPKFQGLEGKRVAVLCVSDASAYGPDTLTYTVSKHIGVKIAQGVKGVRVVGPSKIESWIDENGWEESQVVPLGEGVDADMVIVIEVSSYSIHEGATLFKGRADLTVTVYDITKDGQISFADGPDLFAFPENGRPTVQTSDRQFEAFYLARLTDHISKLFVPYDKMDTFADDAMMN